MAGGYIIETQEYANPNVTARATDLSMVHTMPFVKRHDVDAGYVIREQRFRIWAWNGHDTSESLPDGVFTGDEEGIQIDTNLPTTVAAQTSQEIDFTILVNGPEAFETYISFDGEDDDPAVYIVGTRPAPITYEPRPIDLTTAMEEAYAYSDGNNAYYDTLEFVSGSAESKIMVVYSDEDLTTPQGTFLACKFDCQLPETEGGVRGQMQITVDFLPRDAQQWIMTASRAKANVTVKWRQYLAPNQEPDSEYPIPLEIINVEETPTGVTATALFPDLVNMIFPRRLMTTKELPGGMI